MFEHADQPIWASGFKFVDWGTAHQHELDEAGMPIIEMRKQIEGTDTFMAPEVIRKRWGEWVVRSETEWVAIISGVSVTVGGVVMRCAHVARTLELDHFELDRFELDRFELDCRCSRARRRTVPASTRSLPVRSTQPQPHGRPHPEPSLPKLDRSGTQWPTFDPLY